MIPISTSQEHNMLFLALDFSVIYCNTNSESLKIRERVCSVTLRLKLHKKNDMNDTKMTYDTCILQIQQEDQISWSQINKINYPHETIYWFPFQPMISSNVVPSQSFSKTSIYLLYTGISTNTTGMPTPRYKLFL